MSRYYDHLETRSDDERAKDIAERLPQQIARAKALAGNAECYRVVDAAEVNTVSDLAELPVLRKSDLVAAQRKQPPFGGFAAATTGQFEHLFQSPGPIYEPGRTSDDWW